MYGLFKFSLCGLGSQISALTLKVLGLLAFWVAFTSLCEGSCKEISKVIGQVVGERICFCPRETGSGGNFDF